MDCAYISTTVPEMIRMLQSINIHAIPPSTDTVYSKYSQENYVASEEETPAIREIISQRKEQTHDLDTIVQSMETILRQAESTLHCLREKRDQVVLSMKMHEGFVSRVRRLPTDILREIFMQSFPEWVLWAPRSPNTEEAPLLLTWVCRRWREVAFDTPRLWSSLWITPISEQPVERISFDHEYWLKNARLCPLKLFLDLDTNPQKLWRRTVVDFLRRYTNRCKELGVWFVDASDLYQLLEDVPLLECLSLTGFMDTVQRISIVQPQPRLRTLILVPYSFSMDDLSMFDLGWTNLTHLAVRYLSHAGAFDSRIFSTLLQMCPNLECFVFSPVHLYKHNNPVSLTHPKLRILGMMELYSEPGLLQATFEFPNLRRLNVRGDSQATAGIFDFLSEDISVFEEPLLSGLGKRVFNMTGLGEFKQKNINARTLLRVFNPGWTELTHINLDVKDTEALVLMPLQLCPHLEEIVLSSISINICFPHDPVTHPTLRSLTLCVHAGSVGVLLMMLILPGLRHFDLTLPKSSRWPHGMFKQFLSQSQCPLETLKITGTRIPIQEGEELASLIPTLKRLEFTNSLPDTTESSDDTQNTRVNAS